MVEEILTRENLVSLLEKLEQMLIGRKYNHSFLRNHDDPPYERKNLINANTSLLIRSSVRDTGLELLINCHTDNEVTVKIFFGAKVIFNTEKEFFVNTCNGVDRGMYIFSQID